MVSPQFRLGGARQIGRISPVLPEPVREAPLIRESAAPSASLILSPVTMQFLPTELAGVVVIEPKVFEDDRGFFMESYHRTKFAAAGIDVEFVQDNHSRSRRGVVRG